MFSWGFPSSNGEKMVKESIYGALCKGLQLLLPCDWYQQAGLWLPIFLLILHLGLGHIQLLHLIASYCLDIVCQLDDFKAWVCWAVDYFRHEDSFSWTIITTCPLSLQYLGENLHQAIIELWSYGYLSIYKHVIWLDCILGWVGMGRGLALFDLIFFWW